PPPLSWWRVQQHRSQLEVILRYLPLSVSLINSSARQCNRGVEVAGSRCSLSRIFAIRHHEREERETERKRNACLHRRKSSLPPKATGYRGEREESPRFFTRILCSLSLSLSLSLSGSVVCVLEPTSVITSLVAATSLSPRQRLQRRPTD